MDAFKQERYRMNQEYYTQLAKSGKFNELPSTCEFSEPVKLLVSNLYSSEKKEALIIGKLKGRFFEANFQNWQIAYTIQEPTEHKVGDVVEVETEKFGVFYGMIHTINQRGVIISFTNHIYFSSHLSIL